MSMLIAGATGGKDSAAALVELDGSETRVLAVVFQQSVDRVAHSAAFPSAALDACLDIAKRKPSELDRLVVTGLSSVPARLANPAGPGKRLAAFTRRTGIYRLVHDRAAERIAAWALGAGLRATVETVENDLAYAHLAYRTQPRDPVLIAVGGESADGTRLSLFEARNGQVDPLPLPAGVTSLATLVAEARLQGLPILLAGPDSGRPLSLGPGDAVAPMPGTAGAALGAALWQAGCAPCALPSALLGPGFTDDQAYKALSNTQQPRDRASVEEILASAATALDAGRTVAWARGRAGSNPDLLPSRAILSRAGGTPLESAEDPLLAALLRAGPLTVRPLARPGEPAALSPTDVIRVVRAAAATSGAAAPALLVLGDYLVTPTPATAGST